MKTTSAIAASALLLTVPIASAAPPDDAFAEFARLCTKTVALWGMSECGPMLLVDPRSRAVTANQRDPGGVLTRDGTVWTGVLPADVGVANTAVDWRGTRWSMIMLPLPDDPIQQRVLMIHEAFHRLQPALGFRLKESDNGHLDSEAGRVWLQLEFKALAIALLGRPGWRDAARDALAFRAERRRLAGPAAGAGEDALELNEGLAEYTGVRIGAGRDAPVYARHSLETAPVRPSFVRSFAYETGPAYGLLLDRAGGDWRGAMRHGASFGALLAQRLGPGGDPAHADRYDGAAIRAAERTRALQAAERARGYRARLVDGPVLRITFVNINIEFDPNRVFALAGEGSVYPALHIRDAWGTLDVTDGALLASDWSNVRIAGPAVRSGDTLSGPGWTLQLAAGWTLAGTGQMQRLERQP